MYIEMTLSKFTKVNISSALLIINHIRFTGSLLVFSYRTCLTLAVVYKVISKKVHAY